MRHFVVVVLAVAVLAAPTRALAAQAARQPQAAAAEPQTVVSSTVVRSDGASLSGIITTPDGEPIRGGVVRARNLLTNEIVGSTRTSDKGEYAILNLQPGNYVLELVDDDGAIIGTSAFVAATAGALVSGLTITAASGVLSAAGTTAGLLAAIGATAARGLTAAAAAAGVAGLVVPPATPIASPSR
jgi:hypothetical protein